MQLREGTIYSRRYYKLRSIGYSIEASCYEANRYTALVLQRYNALVRTPSVKSKENLKMKKLEELQRLARSVHDSFVGECIYKIEEAAKAGRFSVHLKGSYDEVEALRVYAEDNELKTDIEAVGTEYHYVRVYWTV